MPTKLPTADELRAHAEALEAEWFPRAAEAQKILDQATEKIEEARRHRAAARVLEGYEAEEPLTAPANSVTDETMNARAIVSPPPIVERRRTGPPINAKGKVGRVAARLKMSLKELAEAIGVNYETVRVWNTRPNIPADGQAKLDKLIADREAAAAEAKKKTGKPAK